MVSKIFSRDGRILCSPRDPQKEAQQWCQRQSQTRLGLPVLIIGVGAGYHIAEYAERNPNASVFAYDLDGATLQNFREVFGSLKNVKLIGPAEVDGLLPQFPYVFVFKAAWQGLEKEFLSAYMYFLGQSKEGFCHQAQIIGIESKFELNGPMTIKVISDQATKQNAELEEVKIWKCLRELVR